MANGNREIIPSSPRQNGMSIAERVRIGETEPVAIEQRWNSQRFGMEEVDSMKNFYQRQATIRRAIMRDPKFTAGFNYGI